MKRRKSVMAVRGAGIALVYLFAGKLSMLLAIPPGYASAIFPSAGVAVAGALVYRKYSWPWIFAGSLLLNLWTSLEQPGNPANGLAGSIIIAAASLLQAIVCAYLVRQKTGYPAAFDNNRDILALFLIAPVAALISVTFSITGLLLLGIVEPANYFTSWITWWIGDLLGILIMLPLTLTFIGQPRKLWRSRRLSMGVPLLVALALTITVFVQTSKWENEEYTRDFSLLSQNEVNMMLNRFAEQESLLVNLDGFMTHNPDSQITREDFAEYVRRFLARFPMIQAIAWIPRIEASDRAVFEQKNRITFPGFKITERLPDGKIVRASQRPFYYPAEYIEPLKGNEAALGFDFASQKERNSAIVKAQETGKVAATAPVQLLTEKQENISGILLVISVKNQSKKELGIAIAVIRMPDFIESIIGTASDQLYFRMRDKGANKIMYDNFPPGERTALFSHEFEFGSREYVVETIPGEKNASKKRRWQSWSVLVVAVFGTSLLGATLLMGTGYTARVETMVQKRSRQLIESEEHFRLLFNSGNDPILIPEMNSDGSPGKFLEVNDVACAVYGYSREEMLKMGPIDIDTSDFTSEEIGKTFSEILNQRTAIFERIHRTRNGRKFPVEISVRAIRIKGKNATMSIVRDISQRKEAEERIRYLAYHDILTNLPNRQLLADRLRQMLEQAKRFERALGVMFLDLDEFKQINDTAGHDAGDELLKIVASRLVGCVRSGDTVARQGGDEFIIILSEIRHPDDAAIIARKILKVLSEPVKIRQNTYTVTTSIGIAIYPVNGTDDGQELMKKADLALYRVKESGKNGFRFFT